MRYSIVFDATDGEPWLARAKAASKYLSREYKRADGDIVFSQGVDINLIKGCAILKHNWMGNDSLSPGFDPQLVHPEFFGVEREDLNRLEDQQAMCHTTYMGKHQLLQMVAGLPDATDMAKKISKMGGAPDDQIRQNWLHQVVLGGTTPVAQNSPSGAVGQVSISPSSRTQFSPQMMQNLLRVDELWVVDDEREDYTTIQLVEGEILIEGRYLHRNLTGAQRLQPFSKICSDPVPGYFWGRSEVGRVMLLQDLLTEGMEDVRRLLKLRVKPPKAFIGFSGLTAQKMRAALAPGGYIQESSGGAKVEDLIAKIPEELFREIMQLSAMFDEVGGFKPILQGEGESGVRANTHAKTLMRTASPKLRERALRIERNAESSAAITFKLMQAKDARVFISAEKEHFMLNQMPDDYCVEVDSHSSSPAFIDDARELATLMKKLGVIDEEGFILLAHPPMEDLLLAGVKKRQESKAKLLSEHPELLSGGKKKAA